MRTLLAVFAFVCISCSNTENGIQAPSPEPNPDVESRSNLIAADHIGNIHLGDSLSSVFKKFPSTAIEEIHTVVGDKSWNGYRIAVSDTSDYFITIESTAANGLIARIRTNDPRYATVDGIAAGQNLFNVVDGKRALTSLPDGFLYVYLLDRNLAFTVDNSSEAEFLKTNSMELEALSPKTTIREIIVGQPLDSARKIPEVHEHVLQ